MARTIAFSHPDLVEIDEDDVLEAVKDNFQPGDVFDVETLSYWAEENGFKKED